MLLQLLSVFGHSLFIRSRSRIRKQLDPLDSLSSGDRRCLTPYVLTRAIAITNIEIRAFVLGGEQIIYPSGDFFRRGVLTALQTKPEHYTVLKINKKVEKLLQKDSVPSTRITLVIRLFLKSAKREAVH